MKRTTIHISAAIALLLGLAACTQDEAGFLPEGAEGTPIVFTATGLKPAATAIASTRAPVDGKRPLKKKLELKDRENRVFEHDSTFFTFRLNNRFSESYFYR